MTNYTRGRGRQSRNCIQCDQKYEVTRQWQLFCSAKCRSSYNNENRAVCYFCGDISHSRYKIDPETGFNSDYSSLEFFKEKNFLATCGECDRTIDNKYFNNFAEMCKYLTTIYVKKYKLTKGIVEWSEDELREVGSKMREYIRKQLSLRQKNERRVWHIEMRKAEFFDHQKS